MRTRCSTAKNNEFHLVWLSRTSAMPQISHIASADNTDRPTLFQSACHFPYVARDNFLYEVSQLDLRQSLPRRSLVCSAGFSAVVKSISHKGVLIGSSALSRWRVAFWCMPTFWVTTFGTGRTAHPLEGCDTAVRLCFYTSGCAVLNPNVLLCIICSSSAMTSW